MKSSFSDSDILFQESFESEVNFGKKSVLIISLAPLVNQMASKALSKGSSEVTIVSAKRKREGNHSKV